MVADDCHRVISVQKDDNFEEHLKSNPHFCFENNYFSDGLKSWQENIDIQCFCNESKAVTKMCSYFSKIGNQCSQAMIKVAKEAFENNLLHYATIKTISRADLGMFLSEDNFSHTPRTEIKKSVSSGYMLLTQTYRRRDTNIIGEKGTQRISQC